MGESDGASQLHAGLTRALGRAGIASPENLQRLTGGATMESWLFSAGEGQFVLRRAPSSAFMEDRPFGHDTEAAVIRAAHAKGVRAPEIVVELEEADAVGSGFVMRAMPGTPDPRAILAMEKPGRLLAECGEQLARIHSLSRDDVPAAVPVMDYREAVEKLAGLFDEAGGDRPIIALGLRWLRDNLPEPVEPVLNHGDFRLGNLLAEDGRLTGVLDWELAHFGDWHEDLAFGCMPVWRFGAYDMPGLGLGSLEEYFAAYEAAGGRSIDPARFRFWTIYRTVWWALGCLKNARMWRSGEDRMLERVVISRRTSEQELDLLMLVEGANEVVTRWPDALPKWQPLSRDYEGEAHDWEIVEAVAEWLATLKDKVEGHDRFQLAVARNALGIVTRDIASSRYHSDSELSAKILAGEIDIFSKENPHRYLRHHALEKCRVDSPNYPSLAIARARWMG